ncbi:hypothetical protein HHI36_007467 [Cryptolaemus montrouzieri]|uniref:CLIP domain-containing serine protease n=1 Tax=Cryptolaemus montrouzieri TaxID=559131 RepID=A0ABD2MPM0_9CUCU
MNELYFLLHTLDPICKPPRGDVCVDIYECPFFESLLEKTGLPRPHHVIKEIRNKQCGFVGKNPAVCCSKINTSHDKELKEETTNEIEDKIQHKNIDLLPTENCGPISLNSRIIHGKEAVLGEFPWMALIVYSTNNGPDFLCGGTLISDKYILTAAHCVLKTIIGVRLGEHDILTTKDCNEDNSYCAPPVQDFYIETIEVHSKYNKSTDHHDIALIRISKPADLSYENVRPICLPIWDVPSLPIGAKFMTVSGWGMTEAGHKSSILKKATLPLIPIEQCQNIFEGHAVLFPNQMCAGGKKEDSCNGDSGGPLSMIVPVRGVPRYVQYGVVSYGPKNCGTLGMPGIYTRVDLYIEWILDKIKP